ncbi:MAG: hypothetical protein U5R06_20620 [candidate division KSB1 bacterium]|nr:hypothetical protein [candidate division KSB1 bacterium]
MDYAEVHPDIFVLVWDGFFSVVCRSGAENTRVTHGGLLPQMISDGAGGAFIVYQDSPALLRQVWVQRLDKHGYVRFPETESESAVQTVISRLIIIWSVTAPAG